MRLFAKHPSPTRKRIATWPLLLLAMAGLLSPGPGAAEESTNAGSLAAPPPPAATPAPDADKSVIKDGFGFGTYGRVQASGDATGSMAAPIAIVGHGPRLAEGPYAEMDFKYRLGTDDGFKVRVLATLAFFDEFFHFSGNATQNLAMRNFYAEASGFLPTDLKLWVGSRMYRGDDIYLLDFWALDNLNTLGGGLIWNGRKGKHGLEIKAHVGANRLKNDFQFIQVSVPATYGAEKITVVNRQRVIASLKATYLAFDLTPKLSLKAALYGETHYLPSGSYEYSDTNKNYLEEYGLHMKAGDSKPFKKDRGFVIGAQLGFWGFAPNSHLNLTARYATGLAAYGELAVPWDVAKDGTSRGAKDLTLAHSFNYESHWFGLQTGGYLRYFHVANDNQYDNENYWEGVLAVRPAVFIGRHFQQMFELSHQWKLPQGLTTIYPDYDSAGGQAVTAYPKVKQAKPQVMQLSVIEGLALDRGMYQRPQFRLVYTASWQNSDARLQYSMYDKRRNRPWQHYIGAQVEWWLDSESYK